MIRQVQAIARCLVLTTALVANTPLTIGAEVKSAGSDGFQIEITQLTNAGNHHVYRCLVNGIASWWDSNHTYTGDGANLKMDWERQALVEILPDGGFVRHMEILFHQPGKTLRLGGGLGPLQEMGVSGALTISLVPVDDGTEIHLSYAVSGNSSQHLDRIAPAVDTVLSDQLARLAEYCDQDR